MFPEATWGNAINLLVILAPRCFIRKWAGRADGIDCASNRCPDIQLIPAPSWSRIRAPVPHRRLDFYVSRPPVSGVVAKAAPLIADDCERQRAP